MTRRLYYDDSYAMDFSARVVERLTADDHPAVILDQTYFYPTGGGQPFDTGQIAGVEVVDVYTREGDAAVVHVLAGDVTGDEVVCRVDWARRFDHMQQHTGQHILTQSFVQIAGANTVGFHLTPDNLTIDLDKPSIPADKLPQVEDLANQVVYENRPVTARVIAPDDAEGVRIRRIPGHLSAADGLRVVEVQDFDLTACGGTHVARTGAVGMIKLIKPEKRGDKTRVEFRCGGRALRDYGEKNTLVNQLITDLTCSAPEIPQIIGNLREQLKEAQRALKAANSQLIDYEAARVLAEMPEHDGVRVVKLAFADRDPTEVRLLASRLAQSPGVVALVGVAGEKAQLIFARGEGVSHDMNVLLKVALGQLDNGRGGGQAHQAQGGGVNASLAQIEAALNAAEQIIHS